MDRDELISIIVNEVMRQLGSCQEDSGNSECEDITSRQCRSQTLIDSPEDVKGLRQMKRRTTARIGIGRCGPRLKTQTLLTLRADHANARDAVFADVSPELLKKLGLFSVQTMCDCKNTHLTRPDLGRKFNDETAEEIRSKCVHHPDVQIIASDGLSSSAIEANLEKLMPILVQNLEDKGLTVGTPFFVRYGRVAAEDQISEILGATVVCILIGERPGLATAESMSAYVAYNAYVGMPESRRTVVSNIHKDGVAAVEAGAYLADVIELMIQRKASGVDLVK